MNPEKNKITKVLLVDDHELMLDGYNSMLIDQQEIQVVGKAGNGKEVITFLETGTADILLLDINMPRMDGVETAKHLKQHRPEINIIILTMLNDISSIKLLVEMGVNGYLLKNCGKSMFLSAIHKVAQGESFFDPRVQHVINSGYKSEFNLEHGSVNLSEREVEIIRMIALGLSTKRIATELYISPHTVHTHRKNINFKLQTHNPVELMNFAIDKGIVDGKR